MNVYSRASLRGQMPPVLPRHVGPVLFGVAALYLWTERAPQAANTSDFITLRVIFQRFLTRREQLRHFMRWLWLTPLLSFLGMRIQAQSEQVPFLIENATLILLLSFTASSLNREHGGRAQEDVRTLDRVREIAE